MKQHNFTVLPASIGLCVTLIMAFLFQSAIAFADVNLFTSTVLAVRGKVIATDIYGSSRTLKPKDSIFLEETIDTGESGRVQLMFTDNSIISLGRQTTLKIEDYYFAKTKNGRLTTRVDRGVFRVMGGYIAKTSPQNFKNETPSGTIGIRGSIYTVMVNGKKVSLLFEGGTGINFKNNAGMTEILIPGFGTQTNGSDNPASSSYKYTSLEVQTMHNYLSFPDAQLKSQSMQNNLNNKSHDTPLQNGANDALIPTQKILKQTSNNNENSKLEEIIIKDTNDIIQDVQENPNSASDILKNAVSSKKMNIDIALDAVLQGMKNPSRESFDNLLNEAMNLGFTTDGAKKIVEKFRSTGGVCK